MPELPEVETTRRGLQPHAENTTLTRLKIRDHRLRWPVDPALPERVAGRRIVSLGRRGKYLLFELEGEHWLMLHLGMSGRVRALAATTPPQRHDHIDFVLDSGDVLRFSDPRRFGSLHGVFGPVLAHPLLRSLGPEPLTDAFSGRYLWSQSRNRRMAVKAFIMDSHVVVGVGNIYAAEALYRAGIHPSRAAGRIAATRYDRLAGTIKAVLSEAIAAGGTTLRDYRGSNDDPGFFQQDLFVYGRGDQPCRGCGRALRSIRLAQRATVYCPRCQR
ncbi:MAG: bifunctional DNA-formamidopyrimidine glycosylase/DNA-(apurinic or apyrimidinic site) lyase [Spiribacter sp.]|nr:bifunctional DNA-formamidopyrimidine glycosylase/DNA-(apurinic or apyrimidinic site) lyase [Spiribacter sp.]